MLFNRTHFNVFFKLDKRVLFIMSEYLLYKIMCHIAAFSYVCIWLLCFVHACLHVYPCTRGGQRSTSGVDPQKSFILSLSQVFLSLGLTNYTRLACVPPAPGPGSQMCAPMYPFLYVSGRDRTQVLLLARPTLHQLSSDLCIFLSGRK